MPSVGKSTTMDLKKSGNLLLLVGETRAELGGSEYFAAEGIEGVEALAQPALHVVDRVDELRVHLDLSAPDHAHAFGPTHAGLVVAVHVGAHGELRRLLGGVE